MRDLKAATWTWQVNPCSALYGVPSASNLNKKTNYLLCTYVESCGYYIFGVMWVLHMWSDVGSTYVESCGYYICGVMWVLHMYAHTIYMTFLSGLDMGSMNFTLLCRNL